MIKYIIVGVICFGLFVAVVCVFNSTKNNERYDKLIVRPQVTTMIEPIVWEEKHPHIFLDEVKIFANKKVEKKEIEKVYVCGNFRKQRLVGGFVKECEWIDKD